MQKIIFLSLGVLLFSFGKSHAQTAGRVAGLERDSVYMSLTAEERVLQKSQDSLQNLITENRRQLLENREDRAILERILVLEGKLFDIRNRLGIIASRMNAVEQEFIIGNLNNGTFSGRELPAANNITRPDLLSGAIFKETIPADDLNAMQKSGVVVQQVKALSDKYKTLYQKLESVRDGYMAADRKETADSLKEEGFEIKRELAKVENDMRRIWNPLYTKKIDWYQVLLDKLNAPADVFESLSEQSRHLRNDKAEADDRFESADFAVFSKERKLISAHEMALAKLLHASNALDSLAKADASIGPDGYGFPKIVFPEKEYIDYRGIQIGKTSVYTAQNPVPVHETPRISTVYKILIGIFAKTPSVSVFKNVSPLTVEELPDGQTAYYAGAYKTAEEAEKELGSLRKLGLKSEIVGWAEGKRIP